MEAEIESLQNVRNQLWRAYTTWSKESHLGNTNTEMRNIGFYEGYARSIEDMGHLTRFTQLEEIVASVHAHDRNIELLNDCIQQVKDEMG